MTAVIFTKDRQMQLDCLLSSIKENCDIFDKVFILYKGDYKKSILELNMPVVWVQDFNFQVDLRVILDHSTDKVCFFVDDDICFKPTNKAEVLEAFEDGADIVSLRLGDNINKKSHFSYKGSLDGTIYKRKDVLKVLNYDFENPNKLEIALCKVMKDKSMAWFKESRVIGIPANKVSDTSSCSDMGVSLDLLNTMHKAGIRIDYKNMNLESNNVHKNENYAFRLV